jgi:nucleotide-binding universal stress UspA family protein
VRLTVVEGAVGPALAEAAEGASLLVTGTRIPPHGFAPGIGRSVAHLLGHAPCPVVVVPQDWTSRTTHVGDVVVGIDGSPPSVAAARFAADTAERWGVALTAVIVGHRVEEDDEVALRRGLAEAVAGLAQDHPDLDIRDLVRSGSASQQILRTGSGARLLVLASGGRGALGTVLLGSTCRAVIGGARCPVAVLPSALASSPDPEIAAYRASSV